MRFKLTAPCILLQAALFTVQGPAAAGGTRAPRKAAAETDALREASGYYLRGSAGKALEICLSALDKKPDDEGLYAYALEILPDGPSKQASALRAITEKASAGKADKYIYYLGFCKLFRGAGQLPQALSNCKKARVLEPTLFPVYRELGLTYSASGDSARAVETLAQGVEISSDNYKSYYYLAAEYERTRNYAAALKNYRKALGALGTDRDLDAGTYYGLIRGKVKKLAAMPAIKPAPSKAAASVKRHAGAAPGGRAAHAVPVESYEVCSKEAEVLKASGTVSAIENKLAACEALAPLEPQTKIDRAGYLTRLGKYERAAEEYEKAAALLAPKDLMTAFCHLKTADLYLKLNDIPDAVRYYTKALEINKSDLNAMLGLAAASEARSDYKTAGELYTRVLKAEPSNAKARERLDEITFNLLSPGQLLEELRGRGAADEGKLAATPDDLKLLKLMRAAERNGAVDYLRSKTAYTNGLILEKREQEQLRLCLTLSGFKSYQNYLTRDAVAFFEKKGIDLRDIFTLRDLRGRPMFEPGGRLTEEGMQAYWQAQTGEKTWLIHYEAVPSPEVEKLTAEAEKMLKAGFREISEAEYLWLMKVTDCPDDVLRTAPCDIRIIKMQPAAKYFLCYSPPPVCSGESAKLATYVERYRAGDTEISEQTRSTAFFGTGGIAKKRFCYQGKIWYGD